MKKCIIVIGLLCNINNISLAFPGGNLFTKAKEIGTSVVKTNPSDAFYRKIGWGQRSEGEKIVKSFFTPSQLTSNYVSDKNIIKNTKNALYEAAIPLAIPYNQIGSHLSGANKRQEKKKSQLFILREFQKVEQASWQKFSEFAEYILAPIKGIDDQRIILEKLTQFPVEQYQSLAEKLSSLFLPEDTQNFKRLVTLKLLRLSPTEQELYLSYLTQLLEKATKKKEREEMVRFINMIPVQDLERIFSLAISLADNQPLTGPKIKSIKSLNQFPPTQQEEMIQKVKSIQDKGLVISEYILYLIPEFSELPTDQWDLLAKQSNQLIYENQPIEQVSTIVQGLVKVPKPNRKTFISKIMELSSFYMDTPKKAYQLVVNLAQNSPEFLDALVSQAQTIQLPSIPAKKELIHELSSTTPQRWEFTINKYQERYTGKTTFSHAYRRYQDPMYGHAMPENPYYGEEDFTR